MLLKGFSLICVSVWLSAISPGCAIQLWGICNGGNSRLSFIIFKSSLCHFRKSKHIRIFLLYFQSIAFDLLILCATVTSSGHDTHFFLFLWGRKLDQNCVLLFACKTWLSNFTTAFFIFCCDRDITLPRQLLFSILKAATSLRNSPGRWNTFCISSVGFLNFFDFSRKLMVWFVNF